MIPLLHNTTLKNREPIRLALDFIKTRLNHLLVLIFSALFFFTSPLEGVYTPICISLIVLLGIPHGAADHLIHSSLSSKANLKKYIFKYIALAFGFGFWWALYPDKALLFFVALSTYHFGQEALENLKVRDIRFWDIVIWGSVVLLGPLILNYTHLKTSFDSMSSSHLPDISQWVQVSVGVALIMLALSHAFLLALSYRIQRTQLIQLILQLAIISTLYLILPFLVAFTAYFIFFHSWNAFKHQYTWLASINSNYSIKRFAKDLLLFSSIAIASLIALICAFRPDTWVGLTVYLLIVISVITLPHTLLFDQFYSARAKPK